MIQIIAGEKGKGKTKILLDKVNNEVSSAKGSVVYLDKSNKHMYELNNKIRLINVQDFLVADKKEFLGFICGIISQDHDLQALYLDSFLKITHTDVDTIEYVLTKLDKICNQFDIKCVISISVSPDQLPATMKENIIVAL